MAVTIQRVADRLRGEVARLERDLDRDLKRFGAADPLVARVRDELERRRRDLRSVEAAQRRQEAMA